MAYTFTNLYSPKYPLKNPDKKRKNSYINQLPFFPETPIRNESNYLPPNTFIPSDCSNIPACKRVGLEGIMSAYEMFSNYKNEPDSQTSQNLSLYILIILLFLLLVIILYFWKFRTFTGK
jgi:hypothetical protein